LIHCWAAYFAYAYSHAIKCAVEDKLKRCLNIFLHGSSAPLNDLMFLIEQRPGLKNRIPSLSVCNKTGIVPV
jgi:hypothetical protein